MTNLPALVELCSYCTFRLGDDLFGFDVLAVKEVSTHTAVFPIPHAPDAVAGYVNLRGNLHLALDLRRMLGMPATVPGPSSRLLVLKPRVAEALGVLVDAIGDIVRVAPSAIEQEPAGADAEGLRSSGLVRGFAKLDGELLIVLDPHRLLGVVERAIRERSAAAGEPGA